MVFLWDLTITLKKTKIKTMKLKINNTLKMTAKMPIRVGFLTNVTLTIKVKKSF